MNIAIIDPGYEHAHSHHHTVNLGLSESLQKLGLTHAVLASNTLDELLVSTLQANNINIIPYFRTPTYPRHVETLSVKEHSALAQSFANELVWAARKGLIKSGSHLLLHTGYAFHILGIAQALYRIPMGVINGIYISLMFDPGSGAPQGHNSQELSIFDVGRHLKYKSAFKLLSAITRSKTITTTIETSCESYRRSYTDISCGIPIGLHPIVSFKGPLNRPITADPNTVLMYLGGPKESKGIEFAVKITERLATTHPELHLIFHFNHDFPGADQYKYIIEPLKRLEGGAIELVQGNITNEHYDSLIARSGAMFIAYDPQHYYFKTSGVLWDGLRHPDMKWIVTDNTWVATELSEIGKPYLAVKYGDVDTAADAIIQAINLPLESGSFTPSQTAYTEVLFSRFGEHVANIIRSAESMRFHISQPRAVSDKLRVLVIRTQYGHFTSLSGPGGFIAPLREKITVLDELLVPLGDTELNKKSCKSTSSICNATHDYITSYQPNSILVEQRILEYALHKYDVIHFLDAEHTGLFTALFALMASRYTGTCRPRVVATFHQPESILNTIIKDASFLNGFDAIHILSPCQEAYFRERSTSEVICLPHGIAPDLLDAYSRKDDFTNKNNGPIDTTRARIILTTGNWLRDFDSLISTARLLLNHENLTFIVVSKGLVLEEVLPSNVNLLNQGIDDDELHALYEQADCLFLPLVDGAANNALLEAMVHGLPIVTTDIPSTRFYTDGLGIFCKPSPEVYAENILETLTLTKTNKAFALRDRALKLNWNNIADDILRCLYRKP